MRARLAKKILAGTRFGRFGTGWTAFQVRNTERAAQTVLSRPKWHPPRHREYNRDRPGWTLQFWRTRTDPKKGKWPLCSSCHHHTGKYCPTFLGHPVCPAYPRDYDPR